jgi:hypothetical protein
VRPDLTKYNADMGAQGVGLLLDAAKPCWPNNQLAAKGIDMATGVLQDFLRARLGKAAADPVVLPPARGLVSDADAVVTFSATLGIASVPMASKAYLVQHPEVMHEGLVHLERSNAIKLLRDPRLLAWFKENGPLLWELAGKLIGW